jgi:hypothetical protein
MHEIPAPPLSSIALPAPDVAWSLDSKLPGMPPEASGWNEANDEPHEHAVVGSDQGCLC